LSNSTPGEVGDLVSTFKAFRIHEQDGKILARFDDLALEQLSPGEVVIAVQYSDINYKDALAATGAGKILRRYPLVGGIDLAGVVRESGDPRHEPGDAVLVTGCGLSETVDGGYAQRARVRGECVIPMPPGLDAFRAMALGTAGFTAALAIHRMERNGQAPARGPVVVTGATGGVGSLAIDMLSARGYEVIAVTGKASVSPSTSNTLGDSREPSTAGQINRLSSSTRPAASSDPFTPPPPSSSTRLMPSS